MLVACTTNDETTNYQATIHIYAKTITGGPAAPEKKGKKEDVQEEGAQASSRMALRTSRFRSTTRSRPSPIVSAMCSRGKVPARSIRGSRKGTPFAAQQASHRTPLSARDHGVRSVEVAVSGPGSGRSPPSAHWLAWVSEVRNIKIY